MPRIRWGYDFVSGYKHKPLPRDHNMTTEELKEKGYLLGEAAWLSRILFLETIAGVPGMVAAMLRHLGSLRLMVDGQLLFSSRKADRATLSDVTPGGSTRYSKKQRTNGCT